MLGNPDFNQIDSDRIFVFVFVLCWIFPLKNVCLISYLSQKLPKFRNNVTSVLTLNEPISSLVLNEKEGKKKKEKRKEKSEKKKKKNTMYLIESKLTPSLKPGSKF